MCNIYHLNSNDIIITTLYLLLKLYNFSDDMNLIKSDIGIHEDSSGKYVYTCKDLKFCVFTLVYLLHPILTLKLLVSTGPV